MKIEDPRRKRHSFVQEIQARPEDVFPLLCPVRELDWVPNWAPEVVIAKSGLAEPECVFITPAKPHNAIWIVSLHDPERFKVEMYKVTPRHTVGKLEIRLSASKNSLTRAEVAYTFTSLGPDGDAFLETFTEKWCKEFMLNWQNALNHYLTTGSKIA